MKKKIVALLVSAVMTLSLLACGGGKETSGDSGDDSSKGQELTVWCWDAFNVDAMKKA